MVAVFVLVAGVVLIMVFGGIIFALMGMMQVLASLVPFAPMLVAIGSFLLICAEMLLFLGNKDDRKVAKRDLGFMLPTLVVSLGLWWLAQYFLW